MSFTIKCDKCGGSVSIKDKAIHIAHEKIDLFPHSSCDGYVTTHTLDIYCNNDKCGNAVEITC